MKHSLFCSIHRLSCIGVCVVASTGILWAASAEQNARTVLEQAGVRGGLVAHVGCTDARMAMALRSAGPFVVHGLSVEAANVLAARRDALAENAYGEVSFDTFDGAVLPYTDNLVNLLLVSDGVGEGLTEAEMLRVVAPGGAIMVQAGKQWRRIEKPRSAQIDDWTHYLHDPSNNAVAQDSVVGPPRHYQWLGGPKWSRHHDRMASMSALVSAEGRLFYILDEGSRACVQLPPKWRLVARDGFSGVVLWKRGIPDWHFHLWPLKSGPAQLPRRLVAVGDSVYATLGIRAPVSVLDAATGETRRKLPSTADTEEIVVSDGVVYALINPQPDTRLYQPDRSGVWNGTKRVNSQHLWDQQPERILTAVRVETGEVLWTQADKIVGLTLAVDGPRVYYHDGRRLVARDRASGRELWRSEETGRRKIFSVPVLPTLVAYGDVVLFAGLNGKMSGYAATDGRRLWTGVHHPGGHHSPMDLLVLDGVAWSGAIAGGQHSGVFTGLDVRTGEVRKEFKPDVETYWFHHRCYRTKATTRFLLPSRTGIEFVDPRTEHWDINHWVRGGCVYGIMPCNGLVYAPPHNCACYLEAKLFGFNALAPARAAELPATGARHERGPAFGKVPSSPGSEGDWPTYRHDALRSGVTAARVGEAVKADWQFEIGGRLSSVVAAGGRAFVAAIDAHTLVALDIARGERLWQFTAGGRIDSPPTVDRGHAVFGCADGWVYCLRASDGVLVWRYRVAPGIRRMTAFGQVESVWPVHGSVLVRDGMAYAVAGRSMFVDGGLRLCRLDVATGRLLSETVFDSRDPVSDEELQARVEILNMPVALPDILSCDGRYVYMRSQKLGLDGSRLATPEPMPPTQVAGDQAGEDRHLFCPAGYLDGTWFHRSYWIYGRRYSSGCNWWHRAGNVTPAGRLMVFNDSSVFGYGRKPKYFNWHVPLDYHLFACERDTVRAGASGEPGEIAVANSDSLDPSGKPLTVAAWVKAGDGDGVVLARGGASHGYAIMLEAGVPRFLLRINGKLHAVSAQQSVLGRWAHLAGVLTPDKRMALLVDGAQVAAAPVPGFISANPNDSMQVGADRSSSVGDFKDNASPGLKGVVDEVRIYRRALSAAELRGLGRGEHAQVGTADLVLHYTFDKGNASDDSGNKNHGAAGVKPTRGRIGKGMAFRVPAARPRSLARLPGQGDFRPVWSRDFPAYVRAMVLADRTLFVAGPMDIIDEEATYLKPHDADTKALLSRQDRLFEGREGAVLLAVSGLDGSELSRIELPSGPVWDGMAAISGRLLLTTQDGRIMCFKGNGATP